MSWINVMVPRHCGLFDYLGITTSLEVYAHKHIPHDYHNVIPLLSMWNTDSHTFISRFHEFTLTFLDVYILTRLSVACVGP